MSTESEVADPFLFDFDALHEHASAAVVRAGLQAFKDNRVITFDFDLKSLQATVVDERDAQYLVDGALDGGGAAQFDCTCAFDAEQWCPHIAASLLAYMARQQVSEAQVVSAAEAAIEERVHAARTEVSVTHVSGEPAFGTWHAKSARSSAAALRPYTVVIRSVQERVNTCTCPDFAVNRLGTFKHIEGVLIRLRKRRSKQRQSATVAVVHLAWDVPEAPRVRVRRPQPGTAELAAVLDRHFDPGGFLRGALPEAWYALESEVAGWSEVSLGDDAAQHARRLAEDALHARRQATIHSEIMQHGRMLPGMKLPLLPYQVQGAAFLAATGHALLADDMGLGKTVQAIAAAHWLIQNGGVRRVLIVAPTSNKSHWKSEVLKFTGHMAEVVDGSPKQREALYASAIPFLVVHYEQVRTDQSLLCEKYPADVLVLDEAQRIKNWRTRTASVVKALPARYVFALSGTPLENRLEELYSLMQRIDNRVLGPLWRFKLDFTVTDPRGRELTYRNLGELRQRLGPVMLRRDRAVIADQLPARTDQELRVPLTPRQMQLHDSAVQVAGSIAAISTKRKLTKYEENRLMAALQTARMACNAAGLVDKVTQGSPKLDEFSRLIETLCQGEQRKVVVFSQWELMTQMAGDVLDQLGVGFVSLHGGVPAKRRPQLIQQFEEDPATMVFLSTDAGATGLNLQVASALIVLDLPWNPAILDQRIARIHRLKQNRNVLVIKLIAAGSYEERVAELIAGKRELFAAAIETGSEQEVVGISKKMIALAMTTLEGLGERPKGVADPEQAAGVPGEVEEATLEPAATGEVPLADEPLPEPLDQAEPALPEPAEATDGHFALKDLQVEPVLQAIEALTRELGANLERVLVARSGVVAIVDSLTETAQELGHAIAQRCGTEVAVLDPRTWASLQRMGGAANTGEVEERYRRQEPSSPPPESPLLAVARRKLTSARVLLASDCGSDAVALLAEALRLGFAGRASRSEAFDAAGAIGWLYGEGRTTGQVRPGEAEAYLTLQGLAAVPEVPEAVMAELLPVVAGAVA
ncbi:MAG: DEAD/DEAH box helicase [Deltaproteobacteria bacterium]|nr:DEAD/DEAH box helicase [Deltaproteobacteria bacterium]